MGWLSVFKSSAGVFTDKGLLEPVPEIDTVESKSMVGLSIVQLTADDAVTETEQVWDDVRAKVESIRGQLPLGTAPPVVDSDFGDVYEIGPNLAMGDEMNRASKLGEDIARGGETLVTEGVMAALSSRADLRFEHVSGDDLLFPYYRAESA